MAEPVRFAIVGAAGRMGLTLVRAIGENDNAILTGALERAGSDCIGADCSMMAGIGGGAVSITDDLDAAFNQADVIVDFTAPAATNQFASEAAKRGIAHIIGTTGMGAHDDAHVAKAAEKTVIVKSGNMSMGVILLSVLVERAAAALDAADWDLEVLEMHHKHKVDAPSGTALLLGEAAAKGRGIDLGKNAVRVRDGHTGARAEGSIGFATLRGGSVVGDHSIILAGNGERVTLAHHAEDRAIFARGAIKAGIWAIAQKPGLYSMRDVLGLT